MSDVIMMGCGALSSPCLQFGETPLGQAARYCDGHRIISVTVTMPAPRIPGFMPGWEACTKVFAAWWEAEDSRKQREYETEQERQKAFVEDVAKGLR